MFKKYNHIENSYQEKYINLVKETVSPDALFVAQEKVDGTNFQFIVKRNESGIIEVACGKRSAQIAPEENFYGWQNLLAKMQEKIIALFIDLETRYNVSEGVNIYGEFFGGFYPNEEKPEGAIQNRIFYSPKKEFYGFDIYIPSLGYIDPITVVDLFNKADIFCAKNIIMGTLDECLALDPVFESTIGTQLGYEHIKGNFAEGYVIKPVRVSYLPNGERIIIKHKNPKFQEVTKQRKVKKEVVNSDLFNELLEIVPCYINEARLENCKSHLGELDLPKDLGKLIGELSRDVLEEFISNENYDSLEKAEQKRFNSEVNKLVATFIKENCLKVK